MIIIVKFGNSKLSQLKKKETSADEFRLCVAAYLRCAIFNSNFEATFAREESIWFGLGGTLNMSKSRCLEILQALSGPLTQTCGLSWEIVSRESHSFLGRLEESICSIDSSLFLTKSTILSIDDDYIRQRSRRISEQTFLKVVNNPKKALAPSRPHVVPH